MIIKKLKVIGDDEFFYLITARIVRREKKTPDIFSFYLIDNKFKSKFDYPTFFIYLLSLIPGKYFEKHFKLIQFYLDFLNTVVIFLLTYLLSKNVQLSIISAIIYNSIFIIHIELLNLTPRIFSSLMFNITFIMFVLFLENYDIIYFIFYILFGVLLLMTHKIEIQASLIVTILCAVFIKNYYLLMFVPILLVAAYILTAGNYALIFKGHLRLLAWTKKFILELKAQNDTKKFSFFKKLIYGKYTINPIIKIIIYNIFILSLIFPIFFHQDKFLLSEKEYFFFIFSIFTAITAIVIQGVRQLFFIGEGYRYLIISILPVCYLNASLYQNNYFWILLIFLIISFIPFIVYVRTQKKSISNYKDVISMTDRLKTLPKDNVLSIPQTYKNMICFYTEKKVMGVISTIGIMKDTYYLPKVKDYNELYKFYEINYVVIEKRFQDNAQFLKDKEMIYENATFKIYEISNHRVAQSLSQSYEF